MGPFGTHSVFTIKVNFVTIWAIVTKFVYPTFRGRNDMCMFVAKKYGNGRTNIDKTYTDF